MQARATTAAQVCTREGDFTGALLEVDFRRSVSSFLDIPVLFSRSPLNRDSTPLRVPIPKGRPIPRVVDRIGMATSITFGEIGGPRFRNSAGKLRPGRGRSELGIKSAEP